MKTLLISGFVCLLLFSCSNNTYQKTPSSMIMSHSEKQDVNYDARENHKVIADNAKNKEANQKFADKQRKKENERLNKLNSNTSKVKKKKSVEAFTFY